MKFFLLFVVASVSMNAQMYDCKVLMKTDGVKYAYPRLSADNNQILYQSDEDGKWQIMKVNTHSLTSMNISMHPSNNFFPDWNNDNSMITFVSDRDGNEEIYLMDSSGMNVKRITNDPERDIHPYFSPDGRYILFNSTRGNGSFDIYRYEIATEETIRITDTKEDETCARYSPDMNSIVYLKNSVNQDDIYVMDAKSGKSVNLTNTPIERDGWPMYSRDGKWIYYSGMIEGVYSIFRIHPDGSGIEQVTFAQKGEENARVYISQNNMVMIYNNKIDETISIVICELSEN